MNEAKPETGKDAQGLDGGYKAGVCEAVVLPLTVTVDSGAGPVDVSERVRSVLIGERWDWPGGGTAHSWHELTLDLTGAGWGVLRRVAVRRGDGPWLLAVVTERMEQPDGVTVQGAGYYVR